MSDTVSDLFQQTRAFAAKCFGFSQQLPTATFMANGTGPVLVKFLCTGLMGGNVGPHCTVSHAELSLVIAKIPAASSLGGMPTSLHNKWVKRVVVRYKLCYHSDYVCTLYMF